MVSRYKLLSIIIFAYDFGFSNGTNDWYLSPNVPQRSPTGWRNGARTSGSAAAINCCARLALLAFSRAWLVARLHCINLVQCVVPRRCGIASAEKKLRKQALLIPLNVVHAPRPPLFLSLSLSLSPYPSVSPTASTS